MLKRLCSAAAVAAVLLAASPARAQYGADKVGPWMFNLQVGPGAFLTSAGSGGVNGSLVLDLGWAPFDADHNAYLLFPFQFGFGGGNGAAIMVPLGFQYDIKLPVQQIGLYIMPRFTIGYAAFVCNGCVTANDGFVTIEVGVKAVFNGRWNVGVFPLSFPVFFGDTGTFGVYRFLFMGGLNF